MIRNSSRHTTPQLSASIAQSVGAFFREKGGTVLPNDLERVPDDRILISFDSPRLEAPVSGLFPISGEPMAVATTLLVSEPIPVEVRFRIRETDLDPLGFLTHSRAAAAPGEISTKELFDLVMPHRPLDELRTYISELSADVRAHGWPCGEQFHERVGKNVATLIHYAVARYYPVIDRGQPQDLIEVAEMFAEDGTYDRAGLVLTGRPRILDFYKNERTLDGTHTVEAIAVTGLRALVTGVFKGISKSDGTPRTLEFADRWLFNVNGEVAHRHTYLSAGHKAAQ